MWLLLYFEVVCSEMENGGKKQEQQWNDSNRKILRKEASGKAMKPHIRISSYKEPTPQIERHIFQMPEQLWTFLPGRWQPLLAFLVELSQINNQENNHHHTSAAGGYETEWQEQGRIHHDIPDPPDNNLYLFDKNAFQTPLDTPFFQGQKMMCTI
ncbi:MAG: hypothetical protein M3Y81_20575 [Chloroflexota bacterium]|nr:hypothetical protein [Chloroflexota bacterium]